MDQPSLFEDQKPRETPVFETPDRGTITEYALHKADRETQIAVMRHWFHANFEDPAENTPYESAEGGYQYIWGGPYDPYEELEDNFGGIVPEEVIEELVSELLGIALEWSGHPNSAGLDDYLFESIAESSKHFREEFNDSILGVRRLLQTKVDAADRQCFIRLLYVNVICALEAYLSDRFISSINADQGLFRKFVETTPEFQTQKVPLSDIFKASEEIEHRVKTYLSEFVWHRLDRVEPMFQETLGIKFPSDMKQLFKAILLRHDFVHRNGKTKDGEDHILTADDIEKLITATQNFVYSVESHKQTPTESPSDRR